MRRVPLLVLALLLAALAGAPAEAQTRVRHITGPPPPRPAVVVDSTMAAADSLAASLALALAEAAAQARADSAAAAQTAAAAQARADSLATVQAAARAAELASRPTRHVFGRSGLTLTVPAGFTAPVADESRLPAVARYTTRQTDPARPLHGALLVVERVVGLNPLDRQRWRFGQSTFGYPGVRPVGPTQTPLPALASIATAGPGTQGATAFLQRGEVFWTVAVVAPDAVWRRASADVLALMAGVALP